MSITASERLYRAMSCGAKPDRVPTLPKIWLDLAGVLMGLEPRQLIEEPGTAMQAVVEAALSVEADAARLFCLPPRRTRWRGETLVEVDATGSVVGPIDLQGGWATQCEDPRRLQLDDPLRIAFLTCWSTHEPLVHSVADVARIAVPDRAFYEAHGWGDLQRKLLALAGDRLALTGNLDSATLAFAVLLRGMQQALIDLLEQPSLIEAILEKGAEIAIERGKFHLACGLKILRLNDSVANMSVISPAVWRRLVLPAMRTVCRELHRYDPDVRIYCHICGNVFPVLEDLVATGIDCVGPLDPLGGFTCGEARAVVGDRVALMGGVHTLSFVNSSPEQLADEARRCIDAAGRDRYVLGSGCALPRSSRRENLLALSRTARQYGHVS